MNKYYSEAKHSTMQIQNALRVIDELVEVSSSILRECDKDPDKNDLAIKYLLNQNQLLEKLKEILRT
tara:strand:- start:340 stop:540 length:201 start_codon:yes stop_codon:yes gene_type:complete